jgi:hypothetical protein
MAVGIVHNVGSIVGDLKALLTLSRIWLGNLECSWVRVPVGLEKKADWALKRGRQSEDRHKGRLALASQLPTRLPVVLHHITTT